MTAGSLKVKIFDAKGTRVVPLAKSTATVGSREHCDVVLEDPSIQGEHMRAWLEGGRIWIQDLGTPGGTFLNGIRLPALKPMLVRDLDVLKLGECPATLGLEANLVRAPVVKTSTPVEEVTVTDIRPLAPKDPEIEKRRSELAKVSRELAELKLQLQMGLLEKNAGEELRTEINALREELRELTGKRERFAEALKRLDEEKRAKIAATESEVAEMKARAERDIKDLRDSHGRKLGHWKVDAVAELSRQIHVLTTKKQQKWTTRALSQDMIFEWESDLNAIVRAILLTGEDHPPAVPEHTHTQITGANSEHTATRLITTNPSRPVPKMPTSSSARARSAPALAGREILAAGVFAGAALVLGAVIWFVRPHLSRSVARTPASPTPAPVAGAPTPASQPRFQTRKNGYFKKTYTENVLYTEGFAETEVNEEMRRRWLAELRRVGASELAVDDKTLLAIVAAERQLVADLLGLRNGIDPTHAELGVQRMRAREVAFQQQLLAWFKTQDRANRFLRLKSTFFARTQSPSPAPVRAQNQQTR